MAVSVYNRQRKLRCELAWLRKLARCAQPLVLATPAQKGAVLATLPEVEITLVDDATIGRVHAEFMSLPEPTDVITFHHGEILISVETAARQALEYGRSLRDELALYLIHGLLHLHGYDDHQPADFVRMRAMQERILQACLTELSLPHRR